MSLADELSVIADTRYAPSVHMNKALVRSAQRERIHMYMLCESTRNISHEDLITAITWLTDSENN